MTKDQRIPSFTVAGYIEQAGTGTLDMIARSRDAGLKLPSFRQDGASFIQTLWRPVPEVSPQVTGEVTGEVAKLLQALAQAPLTREEIQDLLNLKSEANFRDRYLSPALGAVLIEMTVPDKPTSRLQKYRLTDKGRAWLAGLPRKT